MPSEAWERLCPELPPGWMWHRGACVNVSTGRHVTRGDSYKHTAELVWKEWEHRSSITRKRYAELIAVERVQEAVEGIFGKRYQRIDVRQPKGGAHISVSFINEAGAFCLLDSGAGYRPTLCDAAWACIQSLKGESND